MTDIRFGRIFRVSPSGDWSLIAEYDGWPNGLKIASDGGIVIADYKNGLMTLDPISGAVTALLEGRHSESFKGINDLVFGPCGEIYFTDQGQTGMHDMTGCVYRLDPDGHLTQLLNTAPSPNGIAINPSGDALFLAVTRANQIWRIPLYPDGHVAKVGVFISLPGSPVGPDGLAFDEAGNLYVAQPGAGRVWVISPYGDIISLIESCGSGGHDDQSRLRRPRRKATVRHGIFDGINPCRGCGSCRPSALFAPSVTTRAAIFKQEI